MFTAILMNIFDSPTQRPRFVLVSHHELFIKTIPSYWTGLAFVSLGAFMLLAISILIAIGVIGPRLWTHSDKGFIFWGAISRFETPAKFADEYNSQTDSDLNECLSHHLYSIAKVCRRKYFWLSAAILTATLGGLLAAIVLLAKN